MKADCAQVGDGNLSSAKSCRSTKRNGSPKESRELNTRRLGANAAWYLTIGNMIPNGPERFSAPSKLAWTQARSSAALRNRFLKMAQSEGPRFGVNTAAHNLSVAKNWRAGDVSRPISQREPHGIGCCESSRFVKFANNQLMRT